MLITDVIIIGAGAAGLMCAIEAGRRQRKTIVIDHANKPGKKILMSGGGRCNFTNLHVSPDKYISHNPHFCKSALSRYTQWDFINLVKKHKIAFHEKTLGQLFCDDKAKDILNMLLQECEKVGVSIQLNESIQSIESIQENLFKIKTNKNVYHCTSLVIASGGLSIPTMGATPFGYKIAEQFKLKIWPVSAGLVPFTLSNQDKARFTELSGIACEAIVSSPTKSFRENILFTHRGLSGPAILQISNYWKNGEIVSINLLPDHSLFDHFKKMQKQSPNLSIKELMGQFITKRVAVTFLSAIDPLKPLQEISHAQFQAIESTFCDWQVKPQGTEGYRTAEVTLGGVDCNMISSKTMECQTTKGLYFIGEVVDVTGWLGGYNFQWAWSSGWAAGQVV